MRGVSRDARGGREAAGTVWVVPAGPIAPAARRAIGLFVHLACAGAIVACGGPGTADPSATLTPAGSAASTSDAGPTVVPEAGDGPTGAPAVPPDAAAPTATPPPTTPGPASVEVVTTWSLWDATTGEAQVAGFVPELVEDGGTCILTMVSGDDVVEASMPATPDASSTSCGAVSVERSAIPHSGDWVATLRYVSSSSSGAAPPVTIGVP